MHSFGDDANILQNDKFVSYSAVASLVLGAKITDQNTELTMVRPLSDVPDILTPKSYANLSNASRRPSSRTSTWTT
jgi:hypothetical protein